MNPVSSINETDLLIMENLCHVMSNRSENIIIYTETKYANLLMNLHLKGTLIEA